MAFDVTSDRTAGGTHWNKQETAQIELHLYFNKPVPQTLTCIVHAETDHILLMDKSRVVTVV